VVEYSPPHPWIPAVAGMVWKGRWIPVPPESVMNPCGFTNKFRGNGEIEKPEWIKKMAGMDWKE